MNNWAADSHMEELPCAPQCPLPWLFNFFWRALSVGTSSFLSLLNFIYKLSVVMKYKIKIFSPSLHTHFPRYLKGANTWSLHVLIFDFSIKWRTMSSMKKAVWVEWPLQMWRKWWGLWKTIWLDKRNSSCQRQPIVGRVRVRRKPPWFHQGTPETKTKSQNEVWKCVWIVHH